MSPACLSLAFFDFLPRTSRIPVSAFSPVHSINQIFPSAFPTTDRTTQLVVSTDIFRRFAFRWSFFLLTFLTVYFLVDFLQILLAEPRCYPGQHRRVKQRFWVELCEAKEVLHIHYTQRLFIFITWNNCSVGYRKSYWSASVNRGSIDTPFIEFIYSSSEIFLLSCKLLIIFRNSSFRFDIVFFLNNCLL